MTARSFRGLVKEIRALLPVWAVCMLTVAAAVLTQESTLRSAGILAFGFGSLALGAQSIGHELMLPVAIVGMWFLHAVNWAIRWGLSHHSSSRSSAALLASASVLAAAFVLRLLGFAWTNHARAERSTTRLAGQLASIAGFLALSQLLLM